MKFQPTPLLDRLEARIYRTEDCWMWTGKIDKTGYGSFGMRENGKSRTRTAHKIVYEALVGAIPEGMVLDHTCHNPEVCRDECPHKLCVNPAHLKVVTPRENVLRSNGIAAYNAAKTHCDSGHELTASNVYIHPQRGSRLCKECRKLAVKKYQNKVKSFLA